MNISLPPQLEAILAQLRRGIRRYVLLRGVAWVVIAIVVVFWLLLGIDSAWFSLTRLELSRGFRLFLVILGVAGLTVVFFQTIIWQLVVQLKNRALALLLERKFPQLDDRLITIVESAEEAERSTATPLSQRMLDRTVDETCQITKSLSVRDIFNPKPLQQAILLAVIAVISFGATAIASPQTLSHFSDAYLKLSDDYWNRINGLELSVVAQPGNRVKSFVKRSYKHAAGSDLTILATTAEGKVTPEQVILSYKTVTGARGRAVMSPAGEGQFRHTIGNLVDDLEFTVTGGDFTTIRPFQVVTVPEPSISSMLAVCIYPEYTGWNEPGVGAETIRSITSTELSLPMETELTLSAQVTKPLVGYRISGRDFNLSVSTDEETGAITGQCRYLDDRGAVVQQVQLAYENDDLIAADGSAFLIPLMITARAPELTSQESDEEKLESSPARHVLIRKDESLRITLEDADGIINPEPTKLVLHGIPDENPQVAVRLTGIGKGITRKANIPFQGTITDDYGLISTAIEYRRNEETEPTRVLLERQPGGTKRFVMNDSRETPLQKLDILPLEFEIDDVIILSMTAEDGDLLNGPHVSSSETFRLKIVSDEELLSLLYQDELNLRRRFEQLLDELTRSRDSFEDAINNSESDASLLSDGVQRSLNLILKDQIETDAIRAAFADIRRELVNNRIETPQMRQRLQGKIITPLGNILNTEFANVEEYFRSLDFALQKNAAQTYSAPDCLAAFDRLLAELRRVLLEMRKLESFQEVIELLKGIIEEEQALKEKTEAERKKKLIDLLN